MFDYIPVRIEYANMAKINKIRAWARRNNATVEVSRYAKDAYEGRVKIHTSWQTGREQDLARVTACKELVQSC